MKAKIFTLIILGIMLVSVSGSYSQNILTDGDFSSTTEINDYGDYLPPNEWCKLRSYNADADATVVDGVCYYQVNFSGYATWEVQLMQGGFVLEEGHNYRLSFDVKADANTSFGVFLGENEGNWTSLIGYDRYIQYATTDWQTIVLDFKTPCVFAYHKLSFEMGTITTNMYFDNVILEDKGAYEPSIGILGSSLSGWDVDVDMETTDGVVYTLTSLSLNSGVVKFRQDDTWCKNWGGPDFPEGIGYTDGPDILVPNPGNYNITFNRETGQYSFTCVDNCLPLIGIIGSAVPPNLETGPDVDLITSDGITYTLRCFVFTDGGAKFRQDNNWDNNWGSNTFPNGTATLNGEEIPVTAGSYTVTFNIQTGDYSFTFPDIGILGSALNGWDDDIDLATTDGINYTIADLTFTDGEVKFRAENSWAVNWGGWEFPSGWAWQNGPNIYVPAGTYTVTFNRLTGEYSFKATSCPVAGIKCPDFVYASTDPGLCGAYVYYPEVVPASNCGGEGLSIIQTEGLSSGDFFPVGFTTNTFMITNADGNTAYCSFGVYVWDSEPPVVSGLRENYDPLWPPDHKMVEVPIDYSVYDNCGSTYCELYVWSNETEDSTGVGDTSADWEILDDHTLLLRAERSGTGTGREYHINILCRDDSWNYSWNEVVIKVPHDMGNKSPLMISLWPNPSEYNFNLQVGSDTDSPIRVSVSDVMGRQLSKFQIRNDQTITFGNNLMPGTYFVNVAQGSYTETIMILKQ